ncbi:hypothetical protein NUU61_009676 [Penicillium alfredii]|uniref:STF2-like protein n=1 Tax=Penicillium alfredii TaxID=1506179 RepID=A0A9W9EGQ5_9EURO|nr:uncharacterized protein NUU61_009676 [Penicillium alfredii]KAJ5081412.1 hypothetical protein NUU61_009676 [Penicillium alfredii]
MTFTVTRSHKLNDRDHAIEDLSGAQDHLPRYFAKSGPTDADPRKTKKDGGGKGNWGRSGDEMQDYGYKFTNTRRRSNSSTQGLADFRTKFEIDDHEPVSEEQLHGLADVTVNEGTITKVDSTSSSHDSEIEQGASK